MQASKTHLRASDVHGVARLAVEAVVQTTHVVESMHFNIARTPWPLGPGLPGRTRGITGLVYRSILGITELVGVALDAVLAPVAELLGSQGSSREREALLAALNGVLGDHLERSGNPLAIAMSLRRNGRALNLRREALAASGLGAQSKLLVMVHGLCMNDLQWQRDGHDHGLALAQAFDCTPLYLHYNSGRHISSNGREFARLLETLVQEWPVEVTELSVVGHSMGGLVSRSACHYARQSGFAWPSKLKRMVFLGTPHHGAPLERHGNRLQNFIGKLSPYVAPLARLGMLRSAGITDLRHGNLLDEDWSQQNRFEGEEDGRALVALPPLPCYALAATLGQERGDARDRLLADGLVPVDSALGVHRNWRRDLGFPASRRWLGHGLNHWDLLNHPDAYAQLAAWFAEDEAMA